MENSRETPSVFSEKDYETLTEILQGDEESSPLTDLMESLGVFPEGEHDSEEVWFVYRQVLFKAYHQFKGFWKPGLAYWERIVSPVEIV